MRGEPSTDAEIAQRQHGVVARWQLLSAGVSPQAIERRLAAGRLHAVHRGVYLVGHPVPPPHANEMAALLACGFDPAARNRSRAADRSERNAGAPGNRAPVAALSHRSVAAIWGLRPYPATAAVCVTVPPQRRVARPRIEIHRAVLERQDIRRRHGMPLTSPPRTILDLAAGLAPYELERLIAEAQYRRLASEAELRDQLARNPGRPGTRALRAVLDLPGGPRRTRSPAERQMLRLLRDAGIGGYEVNARIHGYEVDLLWRRERLALEIDGYEAHGGRTAFERDRLKTATLEARGLRVMPVTPRRIRDDPGGVLKRLLSALEAARRSR
jgi:very-short-patch-repair endonuclease